MSTQEAMTFPLDMRQGGAVVSEKREQTGKVYGGLTSYLGYFPGYEVQRGALAVGIWKVDARRRVLQREGALVGAIGDWVPTGCCWTLSQVYRRYTSTERAESGQVGLCSAQSSHETGRLSSNQSTVESFVGYQGHWGRQRIDGRKYLCCAHMDVEATQPGRQRTTVMSLAQAVSPFTGHKGRGTEIGGKKSAVISMSCLMLVACQLRIMGNHKREGGTHE